MVSPDKLRRNKDADNANLLKNKNPRPKKRKTSSVLKSKKFYLHFKNLSLLPKCEAQLKDLGALTVPYIDKQVNYVVTDLPGYDGKSTKLAETSTNIISPQCYSVSPATSISGDDPSAAKKTFQTILNKKLAQIQFASKGDETRHDNVRAFHKRFIKLEHVVDCKYRPEFKETSRWPSIDTNTPAGSCPFDTCKSSRRAARRERKHGNKRNSERMNRAANKTENEYGYCEICLVHYNDLSQHVTSSTHLKFVCNDKHYVELDNCMKTRSVEAFLASHNLNDTNSRMKELNAEEDMGRNLRKSVSLHLNNNNNENAAVTRSLSNAKLLADESLKQPLQVQCNGFTNRHLRKSTIKSDSVLLKSPNVHTNHGGGGGTTTTNNKDLLRETRKLYVSCPDASRMLHKDLPQLSPLDEVDGPHRLRSRKNLLLPAILIGTTAEDTSKNRAHLLSPLTSTSNHFLRSSSSPKPCSTTGRGRATPAAVVADEDGGSVKRSNANKHSNAPSQHYTRSANKTNCVSPYTRASTSPPEAPRVNGKPACRRKCSLTTSDDDAVETSRNNVPSYQCNRSYHLANDDDAASAAAAEHNGHGRKRMTVEQKFLEDNKEYYKVEVLPSKLRSTEFYCSREADQMAKKEEHASRRQQLSATAADSGIRRLAPHKRQSALRLLNLEATNFMFGPPKKDDDNDEDDDDDDDDEDSCDESDEEGTKVLSTAGESTAKEATTSKTNDKSRGCTSPNAVLVNRRGRVKERKRRTHAEVFIHDNLDYYKFEISGSRLRHQSSESESPAVAAPKNTSCATATGTTITTSPPPARTSATTSPASIPSAVVKVKEEAAGSSTATPIVIRRRGRGRKKLSLTSPAAAAAPPPTPPLPAAVEDTPPPSSSIKTEEEEEEEAGTHPDIKEEPADGECSVDFYDRPAPPVDSVHFAFESVPAYESWYQAFQRFDLCAEEYIPLPRTVYFTRYRDVVPFPRRRDPERRAAASAVTALSGSPLSRGDNGLMAHFRRKRKTRLPRFLIDDKPRKSPRCHASTLAILSSLTGNRRRSRKLLASLEFAASARKPVGRPPLNRSGGGGGVGVDLEATNKTLLTQVSQEYQKKLKEAVHTVAKDMDRHFIDVFADDDCADAYLRRLKREVEETAAASPTVNGETGGADHLCCCVHIDEEILRDEELLRSLTSRHSDALDDMSAFLESSLSCTSMEAAQDEELLMVPRSNDMLARLCRENDLSCNSSDCGASSTCEFLGFAEDGRTVSRKRKRKRPNMTGWPHDRNKRRPLRMSRGGRTNGMGVRGGGRRRTNEKNGGGGGGGDAKPNTDSRNASETVSEAESECADDEMPPLNELALRKRRRTNNSLSAASDALEMKKNETSEGTNGGERESPSSRRVSKATTASASSQHSSPRKSTPMTRRKSSASAAAVRRNRLI